MGWCILQLQNGTRNTALQMLQNDLKYSIYCHNTDYDCGNLKLTERTEMPLMSRESWEVLDCSEDDEVDQSGGETQAPVAAVAQDH